MPLIVPNVAQGTIEGSTADGDFANVFHWELSDTTDLFAQGTAVLAAYLNTILTVLCDTISVHRIRVMDLSAADGHTAVIPIAVGDVSEGGVHAEALPPSCCYLVGWGGSSERGVRNGRSYLPGVRKDEVDAHGDVSSTTRGAVQTQTDAFVAQVLEDAGAPLVIVHKPAGGSVSTTEILGSLVETPIATQKRRLNR